MDEKPKTPPIKDPDPAPSPPVKDPPRKPPTPKPPKRDDDGKEHRNKGRVKEDKLSLTRDFASGFLMGTGLGVSLTLLLAPRSGAEARRAIADKKRQVKDEASAKAADYRDRGRLAVDKAREALGETKHGLRDAGRALTEPQREQSSS